MSKASLLEDMVREPQRFYRLPGDVLRDRRFNDADRGRILEAWARQHPDRGSEIAVLLAELANRMHHIVH